ncbi:MAG: hypothetical protein AB2A00_15335 [Myxococcota bacterium]
MHRAAIVCALVSCVAARARADHNPSSWKLSEIVTGNLYPSMGGVTIDSLDVSDPNSGEMIITACCWENDCSQHGTYRMRWRFEQDMSSLTRGQNIDFWLENEQIGGSTCPDVEPFIQPCGEDGCPASQIGNRPLGPNTLTDLGGGRFYPNGNRAGHPFHDPTNPRRIVVNDMGNMPHAGYFWLSFVQRWRLAYEVIWYYVESTEDNGGGVLPGECGNLTFEGECVGDVLRWCEDGALLEMDCAAEGMMCGWESDEIGSNCL